MSARIEDIIKRRLASEETLSLFQESVFEDSRPIKEAINSGQRNMQDLIPLLESAKKFRGWVAKQPEGTDLRKAYRSEVTKLGWAEKLPRKPARWGLFTRGGNGSYAQTRDFGSSSARLHVRVRLPPAAQPIASPKIPKLARLPLALTRIACPPARSPVIGSIHVRSAATAPAPVEHPPIYPAISVLLNPFQS